jgi:hypothetical protein
MDTGQWPPSAATRVEAEPPATSLGVLRTTEGADAGGLGLRGGSIGRIFGTAPPPLISRTREQIQAVISESRVVLRECAARLPAAEASRRITVELTIEPSGRVSAAQADPGAPADPLTACALTVVRAMQFPDAAGGALQVVRYPFVFRRGE